MSTVFVNPVSVSIETLHPNTPDRNAPSSARPWKGRSEMIEPVDLAVIDGTIGKERREAFLAGVQNRAPP